MSQYGRVLLLLSCRQRWKCLIQSRQKKKMALVKRKPGLAVGIRGNLLFVRRCLMNVRVTVSSNNSQQLHGVRWCGLDWSICGPVMHTVYRRQAMLVILWTYLYSYSDIHLKCPFRHCCPYNSVAKGSLYYIISVCLYVSILILYFIVLLT